jgi:hypothetical protein
MSLLNCSDAGITYAFLDMVFNKFHVSIEWIIDQGKEFCEEFQELYKKKKWSLHNFKKPYWSRQVS